MPNHNGQSRSGFSKMETDINLFMMQYLEPWFGEDEEHFGLDIDEEDSSDRKSLDEFKDPLKEVDFDSVEEGGD